MSSSANKLPINTSSGGFSIGAIGSPYNMNSITLGGTGIDTISIGDNGLDNSSHYINFSLIKAIGGTIVQCRNEQTMKYDYYVISDKVKNFDKELGKIISMQLLKV